MKIAITGSSGLIGSALVPFLQRSGHTVVRLVRSQVAPEPGVVSWNPDSGKIDSSRLGEIDGVIHLAGAPIAAGRWTPEKKARIRDSRVKGTEFLVRALTRLSHKPKVFLCASAIGFYGNRGEEILTESSSQGAGFLAETALAWEGAAQSAEKEGIRTVNLRFGVVLSPHGGALKMMLPPFQMGVGGILGSGKQYMSWVAIDDLLGTISFLLTNESLRGPINVVSPNPVTNQEFTKTLGAVLRRPTLFPMPAFAVRLLFGELADEALLASARVEPERLKEAGYSFRYSELATALRHLLSV